MRGVLKLTVVAFYSGSYLSQYYSIVHTCVIDHMTLQREHPSVHVVSMFGVQIAIGKYRILFTHIKESCLCQQMIFKGGRTLEYNKEHVHRCILDSTCTWSRFCTLCCVVILQYRNVTVLDRFSESSYRMTKHNSDYHC